MDERQRDLERRWRETGDPVAEAAWLQERLRAGQLALQRLEVAAELRHPAAVEACGGSEGSLLERMGSAERQAECVAWLRARLQAEGLIRLGLAAARSLQPIWTRAQRKKRLRQQLGEGLPWEVIERWIQDPSVEHARDVRACQISLKGLKISLSRPPPTAESFPCAVEQARFAAASACHVVSVGVPASEAQPERSDPAVIHKTQGVSCRLAVRAALRARALAARSKVGHPPYAVTERDREQMLETLRAEFVPWLLGWGDPLADQGS